MTEVTLLTAIGEAEEFLLERSERRRKKKWLPLVSLAACLCLITVLVLQTPTQPSANDATTEQAQNSVADTSAVPSKAKSHIVLYELGKQTAPSSSDIGLFTEDYVAMTTQELESYYGASLRPGWVPEDLSDWGNIYGGIYEKPDSAPYYDQNSLHCTDPVERSLQKGKFANKADFEAAVAHGRSLTVTAAKARPIFYDVFIDNAEDAAQEGKLSTIHGTEALVYHYTFQKADYYGARFMLGGSHFEVTGKNLTRDEFVRVLESML